MMYVIMYSYSRSTFTLVNNLYGSKSTYYQWPTPGRCLVSWYCLCLESWCMCMSMCLSKADKYNEAVSTNKTNATASQLIHITLTISPSSKWYNISLLLLFNFTEITQNRSHQAFIAEYSCSALLITNLICI